MMLCTHCAGDVVYSWYYVHVVHMVLVQVWYCVHVIHVVVRACGITCVHCVGAYIVWCFTSGIDVLCCFVHQV